MFSVFSSDFCSVCFIRGRAPEDPSRRNVQLGLIEKPFCDICLVIMGVEHGGSPSDDANLLRREAGLAASDPARDTAVPEIARAQSPEGNGAVPVTVVDQAEL